MKSRNLRSKGIKDYFGNPIEPGDIILRAKNAILEKREAVRLTSQGIYVKRDHSLDYGHVDIRTPLYIRVWYQDNQPHLMNLTKLNLDEINY